MKTILQHTIMAAMVLTVLAADTYLKKNGIGFNLPWFILGGILGAYWMDIHKFLFNRK